MLMHGAYHYVDLLARYLTMNRRIYRHDNFSLSLSAYGASAVDQERRIPHSFTQRLDEYDPRFLLMNESDRFGETDVVGTFRLSFLPSKRILTLGTFGFEQTTPGMRSWGPFPTVPYNINGRLHATDVDARMATAFSVGARVLKVPIGARNSLTDLRAKNIGQVTSRANAVLLDRQEFLTEEEIQRPYGSSFSFEAEKRIFDLWIKGQDTCSDICSHLSTAALLQSIGLSVSTGGREVSIPFDYPEPEWPTYNE